MFLFIRHCEPKGWTCVLACGNLYLITVLFLITDCHAPVLLPIPGLAMTVIDYLVLIIFMISDLSPLCTRSVYNPTGSFSVVNWRV